MHAPDSVWQDRVELLYLTLSHVPTQSKWLTCQFLQDDIFNVTCFTFSTKVPTFHFLNHCLRRNHAPAHPQKGFLCSYWITNNLLYILHIICNKKKPHIRNTDRKKTPGNFRPVQALARLSSTLSLSSSLYLFLCVSFSLSLSFSSPNDKYLATSVPSRHWPDCPAGGSPSRPWRWLCFRFNLSNNFPLPSLTLSLNQSLGTHFDSCSSEEGFGQTFAEWEC